MSKKSFKKITIVKGGIYAEWDQQEVSQQKGGQIIATSVKKKVKMEPHHNFTDSMERFIPHFMFRAGFSVPEIFDSSWFVNDFLDDERFEGLSVTGLVIGKNEESIRIMVDKETEDGAVTSMISPQIPLVDGGEYIYRFMQIVRDQLQDVLHEAEEFFSKSKSAVPQLEAEL